MGFGHVTDFIRLTPQTCGNWVGCLPRWGHSVVYTHGSKRLAGPAADSLPEILSPARWPRSLPSTPLAFGASAWAAADLGYLLGPVGGLLGPRLR